MFVRCFWHLIECIAHAQQASCVSGRQDACTCTNILLRMPRCNGTGIEKFKAPWKIFKKLKFSATKRLILFTQIRKWKFYCPLWILFTCFAFRLFYFLLPAVNMSVNKPVPYAKLKFLSELCFKNWNLEYH